MACRIATGVVAAILAEAAASPGAEACGLLLGEGDRVRGALACRNVAADPARTFEIDPAALVAAHRRARGGGPAILGCYHSHPAGRAEPSARDAADAAPDGSLWLIAAQGRVAAWRALPGSGGRTRFEAVAITVDPAA